MINCTYKNCNESFVSGMMLLFFVSAAVTAEVEEEEEFACQAAGRRTPTSQYTLRSTYTFTYL